MSEEEKKAINKLKIGEKIEIYELIRTFKREGIENFVITRKKYVDTVLNLIDNQQKEIEELKEVKWYYEISRVPKDKIRAKIKEYEDYGTSIYYGLRRNGRAFHQALRMELKEVLQSLLKED